MRRLATIAVTLATLAVHTSAAHSLEIKNLRLTCGEGAVARLDKEFVWGETVNATLDVHGTKNDGLYKIVYQIYQDNGAIRRDSELPEQPLSDGQSISTQLPIRYWRRGTWDSMLTAGKYVVRIIVTNKTNTEEFAHVDYPVNIVWPLGISNFRLTHGEKGAARSAKEIVKGDNLYVTFELNGATSDGRYEVNYKLYDGLNREIYDKKWPAEPFSDRQTVSMRLPVRWWYSGTWGGSHGTEAGKYLVRIIVVNRASKDINYKASKNIAHIDCPITVVPPTFAIVDIDVAASVMVGQKHGVKLSVVEPKDNYGFKYPQSDVTLRLVNEAGTEVLNMGTKQQAEKNRLEFSVPINEAGRFQVEIEARSGDKRSTVRYGVNAEEKGK